MLGTRQYLSYGGWQMEIDRMLIYKKTQKQFSMYYGNVGKLNSNEVQNICPFISCLVADARSLPKKVWNSTTKVQFWSVKVQKLSKKCSANVKRYPNDFRDRRLSRTLFARRARAISS